MPCLSGGCGMPGRMAVANAIGYAEHRSRSHDAVIRVYDATGNMIETYEHEGEFGQCRDNVQDGIVYAVCFKNVSGPWLQCEARAYPSELKRLLEWRAIPPPWRDRKMRAPRSACFPSATRINAQYQSRPSRRKTTQFARTRLR